MKVILDYLDNKITGSQFVEVLNESVRIGNRTGKIRIVNIPYTRTEGRALRQKEVAEQTKRLIARNQKLSNAMLEEIRRTIISGEATNGEMCKKYGVNPSTISRAVFGRGKYG